MGNFSQAQTHLTLTNISPGHCCLSTLCPKKLLSCGRLPVQQDVQWSSSPQRYLSNQERRELVLLTLRRQVSEHFVCFWAGPDGSNFPLSTQQEPQLICPSIYFPSSPISPCWSLNSAFCNYLAGIYLHPRLCLQRNQN